MTAPPGRHVVAFFALTFAWSWAWWLAAYLAGDGPARFFAGLIAAFGPTLTAFVRGGRISACGQWA